MRKPFVSRDVIFAITNVEQAAYIIVTSKASSCIKSVL